MDEEQIILDKLNVLVQQTTGDSAASISKEMIFSDIRDWNQVKHILLMMAVQAEFDVKFETAEFSNISGIGQLIEALQGKFLPGTAPMSVTDPFDRTVEVIRATFKDPNVAVMLETTADEVPGWDSLSHAVFVMNLERAFGIRFDLQEVLELENVGALVTLIRAKLN